MNHGTRAAYANKGCRCEVCRAANRSWAQRHLVSVYLPEADKLRFDRFAASQGITPSHAVRQALAIMYRELSA